MMETEEWFKTKKYPHIGLPITVKDYSWVKEYVESPNRIRVHSFLPLIHKTIVSRKFRAEESVTYRTLKGERKRKLKEPKNRHIYFASHLDSLIFSKYNSIVSEAYQDYIEKKKFNNSIVAYRKMPIREGSDKNKCNIDFAREAFEFILKNQGQKLTVIVADVTDFFNNLDHKILKKQWTKILGTRALPPDHFNVFKALTNIKYVEGDQLFNSYDKTMLVERSLPNSPKKTNIKRVKINGEQNFKEKNAIAYCDKKDFLLNKISLIKSQNNTKGIPQGSPISASLANIYMIGFDEIVSKSVAKVNGFYQRYSDDLIIICNQEHENDMITHVRKEICDSAKLTIQPKKTKVYRFEKIGTSFTGFEIDEVSKKPNHNKTLEYLGFTFDGERVLLKSSGLSKYHRSMKSSFKKSTSLARYSKHPDKTIFKSRLYKRFTHRGANRKKIFRPSKSDPTKYEETNEYYWGNYLSYINKANDSMLSINGTDSIKRQSRKFWNRFHKLLKKHEKLASLSKKK